MGNQVDASVAKLFKGIENYNQTFHYSSPIIALCMQFTSMAEELW